MDVITVIFYWTVFALILSIYASPLIAPAWVAAYFLGRRLERPVLGGLVSALTALVLFYAFVALASLIFAPTDAVAVVVVLVAIITAPVVLVLDVALGFYVSHRNNKWAHRGG